ncbi:MAG: ABC transporter permease [Myxococcaceae bacterium]|nr:ABC transporter permease [Myxococcaceae bacterium]
MNGTLLSKELRALRPYVALAAVLILLTVVDDLVTKSSFRALGSTFFSLMAPPLPLIYGLIALALGTGISVKERDDGTLAFLDALPVTRTQVFFTKLLAALVVLMTFPGFQLAWALVGHAAARGSLDEPFHWGLVLGALLSQLQLMTTFLVVGTLLGFARSLTWMLVGVVAAALQRLIHFVPRAAMLDPLRLVESGAEGVRWRYDVELIAAQATVASVCTLVAWALFVRAGRSRTVVVNPRPVVGALVTLLTLTALVGAVWVWQDEREDDRPGSGEPDLESVPDSAPAVTATTFYELSYPSIESKPALALADQADEAYTKVAGLLGVDGGAPIFVDLSGSMRNTLGTAFRDRIRMVADDEAVATLAHETTHVIARRLVGEEGFERWSAARVLDEGLASWVEGHFLVHPADEQLVLAALLDRNALQLTDIIDFERFTLSGDDDLKYVIGRGLIDAMVKRYGAGSIHRLIRAFGDEKLPPKLDGPALWQATFQLAGMDLALVADDFFGAVEKTLTEQRAAIDALPRPRTMLVTHDGWYGIEASTEPAEGWPTVVLRFRPGPASPLNEYDRVWVRNGEVAWRELELIRRRQLCFQAGLRLSRKATLFEPWACLPLSSAAPWEPKAAEEPLPEETFDFSDGGALVEGDEALPEEVDAGAP